MVIPDNLDEHLDTCLIHNENNSLFFGTNVFFPVSKNLKHTFCLRYTFSKIIKPKVNLCSVISPLNNHFNHILYGGSFLMCCALLYYLQGSMENVEAVME
jgi:hypothetical protein